MDGILVINKPAGLTSHDVVSRVRRITGQRHAGHAGTLDPLATGVLVVCLGQATRLAEYLTAGQKTYCAEIVLGVSTDTYDAEGQVTSMGPVTASLVEVRAALDGFLGEQMQVPPAFSAIKSRGVPLYRAARAGQQVIAAPRPVTFSSICLLAYEPPALLIQLTCGPGTYVRSLAHDLGERLGCGGHLTALVRLRSGRFDLEEASTLGQVAAAVEHGYLDRLLYPLDEALLDAPALILGAAQEQRVRQGRGVELAALASRQTMPGASPVPAVGTQDTAPAVVCRAYGLDGDLLAVGLLDVQAGCWQPSKVFVGHGQPETEPLARFSAAAGGGVRLG